MSTLLQSLCGKVSDGTLPSTAFVKTHGLPATFVYSNELTAIFAQETVQLEALMLSNVLPAMIATRES